MHISSPMERFERFDVRAGDRPSGASFASRSAALGRSGAAGTAHPLATLTAIETLKRGGCAADAAIAAAACLGFLEPTGSGLGGDCYVLVWDPRRAKLAGLAGSGRSPHSLSLETVRSRAKSGVIPPYGAISVSTPGALDAWWTLHRGYGVLEWRVAVRCRHSLLRDRRAGTADHRLPLQAGPRGCFASPAPAWKNATTPCAPMRPTGDAPQDGDIFRNPDLARTYRAIAAGGRDVFYEGPIARTIDAYFKRIGGWLSREDLRDQHAEWVEPLVSSYRGVEVYAMGANTQGLATLQMLNILEHFDLRAMGFQSAASIHVQAEAKRLAFEDRARFYADPHFAQVPVAWLGSKDYAAERAKLIRPDRILSLVCTRASRRAAGDTTYLTVADSSGMMVSMIQSNYRGMGSGLVADGLGFMFQDRGQLFSLEDGHPNQYQPGKRPFHTIIPGFAARDGRPWMSFGVMGGDMQPQGQTQIIVNRVDFGLDVQAAGDSPRWHHVGSSQRMGEDEAGLGELGRLHLESGVPERSRRALAELGWPIGPSDGAFGRYHCIEHRTERRRARLCRRKRNARRWSRARVLAHPSGPVFARLSASFPGNGTP